MDRNSGQQTLATSGSKFIYTTISGNQIEHLSLNIHNAPSVNTNDINIDYCPAPVPTFIGRREELGQLKTLLTEHQVVAVVGMGGLGKTQLIRRYASVNKAQYRYRYWLESETRASLVKSFNTLAKKLHINCDTEHETVNDVYKMADHGRLLLVFDNVDRPEHVYEYLPTRVELSPGNIVHVLLTSRWTDWTCDELIACYPLQPLNLPVSLELLERKIGTTNINARKYEWEKLVCLLGNLPLAIQVAAAYLQKRIKHNPDVRQVLADYMEQLNKGAARLLNDPLIEYGNQSIYTSMLVTLEQLGRMTDNESRLAVRVINTAAYLNPDRLYKKQLLKLLDTNDSSYTLDDALVILTEFSLFNQDVDWSGDMCYTVHRIIQTSVRHNQLVKRTCDGYYTQALKYTLIDEIFPDRYVFQYIDGRAPSVVDYSNLHPSSRLLTYLVPDNLTVLEAAFQLMRPEQIQLMVKQHGFVNSAIQSDNLRMIQLLYKFSASNEKLFSENGETLLHCACMLGRVNIVKWLLANGACPSVQDMTGCTPLHRAAEKAQHDIAQVILDKDTSVVHVKNNVGQTPLHCIQYFCNSTSAILATLRVLIVNGADISKVDAKICKILHYAIDSADSELVSVILHRNSELLNMEDDCGQTAMQVVPCFGLNASNEELDDKQVLSTVRVLLAHGANVPDVQTLHYAAKCADSELVSLLVKRNNKLINTVPWDGRTALHVIGYNDASVNIECILATIRILVEFGADIAITDKRKRTVLHAAANGACAAAVSLILELKNDLVNTVDENCQTALQVIPYVNTFIRNGRIVSTMRTLIENGADVTNVDKRGYTVLHLAARSACVTAVSLILELNKDVIKMVDENGQTALHVVRGRSALFGRDHSCKTIARELMKNGLSLDNRDKSDRTPLDTVPAEYKEELLELAEEYKGQTIVQSAKRQRTE